MMLPLTIQSSESESFPQQSKHTKGWERKKKNAFLMGQYKATCFLVPGISHNINFSANPFSVPAIITHETRVWPTDTCKCNTPKPVPVQRGNGARRVSLHTWPFVPVISVFKDWNLRFAKGYNKHYNLLRPKRLRLNHTQRRNTRPKPLGDK